RDDLARGPSRTADDARTARAAARQHAQVSSPPRTHGAELVDDVSADSEHTPRRPPWIPGTHQVIVGRAGANNPAGRTGRTTARAAGAPTRRGGRSVPASA